MRHHCPTQCEQALPGCGIAKLYCKPQNVRVELLAYREEVQHECCTYLTAEEAHRLEEPANRQAIDRVAEGAAVNELKYDGAHQSVEAERQTNGHDCLRTQEVGARPCRGKLRVHQAGDRYQGEACSQDQPGVYVPQQIHCK